MANRKCYEALSDKELLEEIRWRRGQNTRKVGAEWCMVHADIIKLCYEILRDRGVEIPKN